MLKEDKNLSNGLKILIATGIFPPDIGGPATYLPQFIDFLESQDCDVKVVTFSDSIESSSKVFRVLRKNNIIIRFLKYFLSLWKESKDVDLIYLHDVSLVGLSLLLVNFFRRKKYIIRIGGDNIWEQAYQKDLTKDKYFDFHSKKLPSFGLRFKKKILKFLAKNSEKIIVPSNFLKESLCQYGISQNKIEVVFNAIDINISQEVSDVYNQIENYQKQGQKVFVSTGRLINWKNFDYLINLFSEVKDSKLFIIGNGPEEKKLEDLIHKNSLEKKVFLIDKVKRGEWLKICRIADAFVLLSVGDTFSFASLEALLSGVRLILAREGALEEIFGDFESRGVKFVDLDNKEEIIRLLNDIGDIKKIDSEDLDRLKNKYSYQEHLNKVYNIILNIVK
jgi:glycosyltransferase involved in cell wall biosynthesis